MNFLWTLIKTGLHPPSGSNSFYSQKEDISNVYLEYPIIIIKILCLKLGGIIAVMTNISRIYKVELMTLNQQAFAICCFLNLDEK